MRRAITVLVLTLAMMAALAVPAVATHTPWRCDTHTYITTHNHSQPSQGEGGHRFVKHINNLIPIHQMRVYRWQNGPGWIITNWSFNVAERTCGDA